MDGIDKINSVKTEKEIQDLGELGFKDEILKICKIKEELYCKIDKLSELERGKIIFHSIEESVGLDELGKKFYNNSNHHEALTILSLLLDLVESLRPKTKKKNRFSFKDYRNNPKTITNLTEEIKTLKEERDKAKTFALSLKLEIGKFSLVEIEKFNDVSNMTVPKFQEFMQSGDIKNIESDNFEKVRYFINQINRMTTMEKEEFDQLTDLYAEMNVYEIEESQWLESKIAWSALENL